MEAQGNRQKKFEAQVINTTTHITEDIIKMQKQIDDVESRCAWRDVVEKQYAEILEISNRTSEFIDEIETGKGERVQRFVESYLRDYLPEWYKTVEGPMWSSIDGKLTDLRTEAARRLEIRTGQAEEKARALVAQTKTHLAEHTTILVEERRRDLQKFREQMADKITTLHDRVDKTNSEWISALKSTEYEIDGRLEDLNTVSKALHRTLCLDESLCAELVAAAGGADASKIYLSLEEAQNDPRVAKIQRTPHFLHLRTAMQREVNDRVELLKAEVHQDLASEMFEIQREMKSKVAISKMAELLESHKDQALYSNVRNVLGEVVELRRNKLDNVSFLEALRSKADVKIVDTKVDSAQMNSSLSSVNARVDEVDLTVAKSVERLRQIEQNAVDLAIFVKTGRPPDRDFPTTKTVAELLAENVKGQVDAILVGADLGGGNGEIIVPGDEKREGLSQLVPAKPKHGGARPATSGGRSAAPLPGSAAATGRVGSARPGVPIRGLPSSRAQSARSSIVSQQQQQPPDNQDGAIPMTSSQRAYCEALALEQAETERLRSARGRPPANAGAGIGSSSSSARRQRSARSRRSLSIDDPEMIEEEIGTILPELRQEGPPPMYLMEPEGSPLASSGIAAPDPE